MVELYKIMTGKYDEDVTDFIELNDRETRGHKYKIYKTQTRLNIRSHAFVHRSLNIWNNLPEEVVNAQNVETFERRLDRHWRNEPAKYDSEADINVTLNSVRTAHNLSYDEDLMSEAERPSKSEEDL